MYPTIIIFGRVIGTYALCAIIGLIVCGAVAKKIEKPSGISFEDVILLMLVAVVGLTVGGHLLYGITNVSGIVSVLSHSGGTSLRDLVGQLAPYFSGSVFYGGFIGGTAALTVYTGISKSVPRKAAWDLWAICVPLFHFFGRIGCFLGGCCYGVESSIGFITWTNTVNPAINGVRRFPVALAEALCNLGIFVILLALHRREKQIGKRLYIYMILYAPIRFLLEFLRGDSIRGFWFGLSTSQWISLVLFGIGVAGLTVHRNAKRAV